MAAAGPGIVFTGWVDDTSQYFRHASIVMAPLRQGGGMRVKIVEASSFGKAIIASALAIEGLGLRDGVECIVADSDDAFATTAIKLLQNRERIREIGMAASRWAGRTQDSAAWLADYERLYARLFKPREASSISQDPKRLVDS